MSNLYSTPSCWTLEDPILSSNHMSSSSPEQFPLSIQSSLSCTLSSTGGTAQVMNDTYDYATGLVQQLRGGHRLDKRDLKRLSSVLMSSFSSFLCERSPSNLLVILLFSFPAEKFVQLSLRTFAEPKELELRMSQILECVTADLPEGEGSREEKRYWGQIRLINSFFMFPTFLCCFSSYHALTIFLYPVALQMLPFLSAGTTHHPLPSPPSPPSRPSQQSIPVASTVSPPLG
jgi:hypothetical protein